MTVRPRSIDRADEQLRQRKTRDRAIVLLIIGAVLFMPPVAGIADIPATVGGIPVVLIYVFAVWAGLIAAAILLAPGLHRADEAERSGRAGAEDSAP